MNLYSICAALAKPVCDELKIPLIGHSLPINSNKEDEKERAKMIGKGFCTKFKEISLAPICDFMVKQNLKEKSESETEYLIRLGNIKARLRMIHLFDLAQKNKGMVLSTDNYTEYLLGFWTLHGDVGNYGMVQNLWKTEIYKLSEELVTRYSIEHKLNEKLALQACIDAVPTDGLGITNSDLDQLEVNSYKEVDRILSEWLSGNTEFKDSPIVKRHLKSQFKRRDPLNISRDILMQ